MTAPACRPLQTPAPIAERERPDRLAEILECMADLLVEARRERAEIVPYHGSEDPRVPEALSRLTELERSLREVGTEAAAVHQLLQHIRLI
jgi:glyoxylase-like metal-dependent hydrolase (beta-lactamase superfamily II)